MAQPNFLRTNPHPKPIDVLQQPDFDVREYRTDEDINNIADSLAEKGQVMPVLIGQQQGEQYPVLDGNHRVLAAKRLGWDAVDCIQTKAGANEDEVQIIANISRLELSPSEKLATFNYMLGTLDMSVKDASDKVGIHRSQAHRYKEILLGYGEIKEYYMSGELGVQACYELNMVDDRDRAVDIAKTAVREGYHDKDVAEQAKFARGEEAANDEMRGAGTQENVENIQQVKRNAQAISELDDMDQQAVNDAQVQGEGPQAPPQDQAQQQAAQEPQGPPCMACGDPMQPAPLSQVVLNPQLAQQLGVDELRFGPECTGKLIEWWQQRQGEADVDGAEPDAEADAQPQGE
jgi:ParB/RepB/Spo0J family partition protein